MSGMFHTDRRDALKLAAATAALPAALNGAKRAPAAAPAKDTFGLGRGQLFDHDWRFLRGVGEGREVAALDDSAWRTVTLPHDWSIEDVPASVAADAVGPFNKKAIGGTATGFTEGGEGWYRKHFQLAAVPEGALVEIEFDGVLVTSDVWLNGTHLGSHVHGYTPFTFNLTPHLVRDGDNVLAVRVRNLGRNSRWYAGSGLYRQVKMNVLPGAARIARWGVGAWTKRIANGQAHIDVTTQLEAVTADMVLVTRLRTPHGQVVAEARMAAMPDTTQTLLVKTPQLWSPISPHLYTLESVLLRDGKPVDQLSQPFGIRIITMDAEHGMRINGVHTNLRGGCIHHDNGLLGAAAYPDADLRKVRLLKARGFNAIRSSHNPASTSLRTACDTLGMFLIEEAFDMWHVPKLKDDYSNVIKEDWQSALEAMVLSARNSPSVIMWSIGNEIPSRSSPEGLKWSWEFANKVRTLDPTRPVTAALNGLLGAPMVASAQTARPGHVGVEDEASAIFLDVAGYNYRLDDVESDHKAHPDRIIFATETFPQDAYDYRQLMARAPYFLGEFVWTAMDYLGEAGIGATVQMSVKNPPIYFAGYPWVDAWCGDIDLIGQQKPPSLARDVVWGLSPLEIMVQRPVAEGKKEVVSKWGWHDELPSWSWPDATGKTLTVRTYTAGDSVELRLNGTSLGRKAVTAADKMVVEFKVAYAPGVLEAIAYRGNRILSRKHLNTVSAPAQLRLTPEAQHGHQLTYVGIEVLDTQGRLVPEAEVAVQLYVQGARLLGFGSGNPKVVGSFQSHHAKTFRGRALAIVQNDGRGGAAHITAHSAGLSAASAHVVLK